MMNSRIDEIMRYLVTFNEIGRSCSLLESKRVRDCGNDYVFLSRTRNLYEEIRGTTELVCQVTGSGRLG